MRWEVVNCFQILLSSGRRTTMMINLPTAIMLWIAFKFYYLRDEEQRIGRFYAKVRGCELLSNFIIFGTKNNLSENYRMRAGVVNCFQILLSSGRRTTNYRKNDRPLWLWIAFKFYYLRDEEQLRSIRRSRFICCELLSNFIIFGTKNNSYQCGKSLSFVVNCFQILLSSGRRTTVTNWVRNTLKLWIAFKFYYLRDEEQL